MSKAVAPKRQRRAGGPAGFRMRLRLGKPFGNHFVTLHAFIDDSASDTGDKSLFLCGYVGTAEKWDSFSDDWIRALNEHPQILYLKMSEAFSLNGQFHGWRKEERDKKLISFAVILEKYDLSSVSCSVSRKDYTAIVSPVAPHIIGNPYFPCFFMVTVGMARLSKAAGHNMPVNFIFDEQGQLGLDAAIFYEDVKNRQPSEIRDMMGEVPAFKNDQKAPPLQAADMLAWHIRRKHEFPESPALLSADQIIGSLHMPMKLEQNAMQKWAKEFSQFPGVGLTNSKKNWSKMRKEIIKMKSDGLDPSKLKWPLRARVLYWLRKALNSF